MNKKYKIDINIIQRKINSSFKKIHEILSDYSVDDVEYSVLLTEVYFLLLHDLYHKTIKEDGILEAREFLLAMRERFDSNLLAILEVND